MVTQWCGVAFACSPHVCLCSLHVHHYEGYSESVSCSYESQYQNSLKYICRGNQPSTCLQQALITSDNKQNGRFRLDDDKVSGTFTVTINSLTQNDSGSYLCGVQRNSEVDVFSAVELEVEERPWFRLGVPSFVDRLVTTSSHSSFHWSDEVTSGLGTCLSYFFIMTLPYLCVPISALNPTFTLISLLHICGQSDLHPGFNSPSLCWSSLWSAQTTSKYTLAWWWSDVFMLAFVF
uniref:Ig-like domain-containing protein n=1 Tax=Neolamprologus brichardi TaxID=32507 RepID=A0A3Q4IBI3_NEOBR